MTTKLATRSGRLIDLAQPDPNDVCIHDIAWSLAHEIRWNGCLGSLSVAQHSVAVADVLKVRNFDAGVQLCGLLHDAHEAYFGDTATPAKNALRELGRSSLDDAESTLQQAIHLGLGIACRPEYHAVISAADSVVAKIEAAAFGSEHWKDAIRKVAPGYFAFDAPAIPTYARGILEPRAALNLFVESYRKLKSELDL